LRALSLNERLVVNAHPGLSCRDPRRRKAVRAAPQFGLDFVDVSDDQLTLEVFFLGKAPENIGKANVRIDGGRRVRDVEAASVRLRRNPDPALDDSMEVRVNRPGDYSTYTLRIVKVDDRGHPTDQPLDGFDVVYDHVDFSFKAGCPTDLDCKTSHVCPRPSTAPPDIDYLAKDYASFRQRILDRMALTIPAWQESHAADIGITLVELLAYVADQLSYYQDAVATEAYLGTARQRISVRRHARLVDYTMHEGSNARTWIALRSDVDVRLDPRAFYLVTGFPGSPPPGVLQPADIRAAPPDSYEVFEPLVADPSESIDVRAAHSEIHFYTWGDARCCLAKGTTSATLVDHWVPVSDGPRAVAGRNGGSPGPVRALNLKVGDVLLVEEVVGPTTGNPADADPTHRQAIRLTKITPAVDPLVHPDGGSPGQPVVEIEWCSEDALAFALCISAQGAPPECLPLADVSVARGNVFLADHGARTDEPLGTVQTISTTETCATECSTGESTPVAAKFRPCLNHAPLTFSELLPACGCASAMIAQDPRQALPQIALTGTRPTPHGDVVTTWTPKRDLLNSGPNDGDFVVEIDNRSIARLRFGDGIHGRVPEATTRMESEYRVGSGPAGNVGAETLVHLVFRTTTEGLGGLIPRNPLPARGGTAPEPIDDVKMFAPYAFRTTLERAIVADDYAVLAADNARRLAERPSLFPRGQSQAEAPAPSSVDRLRTAEEEEPGGPPALGADACLAPFRRLHAAKATLRWTGSWYEALVAIHPLGTDPVDDELLLEISAYLERYRRMGHDVEVRLAQYVPLDVAITVCILQDFRRGDIEAALLDIFSNRVLPDGTLGLFHPDNLTFGASIYVSRIVAAAHAIAGVQDVRVTRLARFEFGAAAPPDEPGDTVPDLALGPFEIARLDNDPNAPQNGRLTLDLRGGR
jgi:hypothetical protein